MIKSFLNGSCRKKSILFLLKHERGFRNLKKGKNPGENLSNHLEFFVIILEFFPLNARKLCCFDDYPRSLRNDRGNEFMSRLYISTACSFFMFQRDLIFDPDLSLEDYFISASENDSLVLSSNKCTFC